MAIDASRWRTAAQPPAQAQSRNSRKFDQKRKQRQILLATAAGVFALSAAGYGFYYWTSAPERASAEMARGLRQMVPGRYENAVKQFTRAVSIFPVLPDAYLNRGIARHNLGETQGAVNDLEQALLLNPSLSAAHNELGQIYSEKGDTRKALEHLNHSVEAEPTANGYYQRGQLHEKLGEHQSAVDDFNLAIAELSSAPYIYFARASARQNLGDTEGAKSDRARALELSMDFGKAK